MRNVGLSRRQLLKVFATAGALAAIGGTTGCSAVQQALSGGGASLRYMGHFTALGDTARDRAQKQIEERFKEKHPNITIQWE